jgi:hypothetical protein
MKIPYATLMDSRVAWNGKALLDPRKLFEKNAITSYNNLTSRSISAKSTI